LSGFQSVFQIILDEIFEFGAGNHSVHMSEHKAFRHLVLGNLGLLSTASTLIVSFVGGDSSAPVYRCYRNLPGGNAEQNRSSNFVHVGWLCVA
jgi:hypothetical protein